MKLETIKTDCKEIFVEHESITVMVNTWSNCEGVNVLGLAKDNAVRFAASLRWEEADALIAALAAARAV